MHSVILAATSDYFHNIIAKGETTHHIDFAASETLEHIIRYCYTGQIELNSENIQSIALVSNEFKMQQLVEFCNQYLESTSDTSNYLKYAIIAERCGLKSSNEFAEKFVLYNCSKMCDVGNLGHLPSKQLTEAVANLCNDDFELFANLMKTLDFNSDESSFLLLNSYQAVYRTFVRILTVDISLQISFKFVFVLVHWRLHSIVD